MIAVANANLKESTPMAESKVELNQRFQFNLRSMFVLTFWATVCFALAVVAFLLFPSIGKGLIAFHRLLLLGGCFAFLYPFYLLYLGFPEKRLLIEWKFYLFGFAVCFTLVLIPLGCSIMIVSGFAGYVCRGKEKESRNRLLALGCLFSGMLLYFALSVLTFRLSQSFTFTYVGQH